MSALVFTLLVLSSNPAHTVDFLGFSADNAIGVWRNTYVLPQDDGGTIRFTLAELVDVKNSKKIATYRSSPIRKTGGKRVAHRNLESLNSTYQAARSLKGWHRYRKKNRLRFKKLDLDTSVLRISTPAQSQSTAIAEKRALVVSSKRGAPLVYQPVVRKYSGETLNLRPLRSPPRKGEIIVATLEAFYSPDGASLALRQRLSVKDDPLHRHHDIVSLHYFGQKNPVGTHAIGTFNVIRLANSSVDKSWQNLHPSAKAKRIYDRYKN